MSHTPLFLDDPQLVQLTGRKNKSRQIDWLRQNAITFRVNATGHPVVTRLAIEGRVADAAVVDSGWRPRVLELQRAA
jgi:hypothetical protein